MKIDEKLQHAMWCMAHWADLKGIYPECDDCPFRPADQASCDEIDAMAMAAYEALTPRLMTLEEVEESLDEPVWVEEYGDGVHVAIVDSYRHMDAIWMSCGGKRGEVEDTSYYGRLWRCWTLKPSEGQRKAAGWEE